MQDKLYVLGDPKKTSRARSKLAPLNQKLLSNALYHSLVERLSYLLRCCMVILGNDYHPKNQIFQRKFLIQIPHFE